MPSHLLNDTDIASQSLYLHSNDAVVSLSSAEKIFYLNQAISVPQSYRILIGLTNLTMPNAMYNVTNDKNTIVFFDGNAKITVTVPAGNYSATSLETEFATQLTAINLQNNISITFDDEDNVFKFSFSSPLYHIVSSTMQRVLGLSNQLPTSPADKYTAKNVCDLGGVTNIYIRLRNVTMNNLDSRGKTNNIIASIVNNTNYGGYIFYTPPEVLYYQITETNISHIDVELTDQEGFVLDLNGAEFNFTITFHYIKQRHPVLLPRVSSDNETSKLENK